MEQKTILDLIKDNDIIITSGNIKRIEPFRYYAQGECKNAPNNTDESWKNNGYKVYIKIHIGDTAVGTTINIKETEQKHINFQLNKDAQNEYDINKSFLFFKNINTDYIITPYTVIETNINIDILSDQIKEDITKKFGLIDKTYICDIDVKIIVTKMYKSISLTDFLKSNTITNTIISQILDAIIYLNKILNIRHLDLHFGNIMIETLDDKKYKVRIFDFDKSRIIGPQIETDNCKELGLCNNYKNVDLYSLLVGLHKSNINISTLFNNLSENIFKHIKEIEFKSKSECKDPTCFYGKYCNNTITMKEECTGIEYKDNPECFEIKCNGSYETIMGTEYLGQQMLDAIKKVIRSQNTSFKISNKYIKYKKKYITLRNKMNFYNL